MLGTATGTATVMDSLGYRRTFWGGGFFECAIPDISKEPEFVSEMLLGGGSSVRIYSGPVPATSDEPIDSQT